MTDEKMETADDDKSTPPVTPNIASGTTVPSKRNQAAKEEEAKGIIKFSHVVNDTTRESCILSTGLKNIYQMQLPKMPREYIARLVYDRNHKSMAIVKKNMQVVGGITYRPFEECRFAEIVFCAIASNEQVKGYGSLLMNHLKSYIRTHTNIDHFLTYADNYAIGYFKKQGFTTDITLDRSLWAGYIKDYEGGTIMQCTMVPKIDYLDVNNIVYEQRKAIQEKVQEKMNDPKYLFPGLDFDKLKQEKGRDYFLPEEIPGLLESGWTPELEKTVQESAESNPIYPLLRQLWNDIHDQTWSWPFIEPVDAENVPDYYDIIKNPMDLKTMEHRMEHNFYETLEAFAKDFNLIISNCKLFNDPKSVYVKCAVKLDQIFKQRYAAAKELLGGEKNE